MYFRNSEWMHAFSAGITVHRVLSYPACYPQEFVHFLFCVILMYGDRIVYWGIFFPFNFFFHLFFTCGLLIALLSLVEVQGDASVHADAPWKLMGAKGAFKFPAKIPFKNLLLLEILQLSRKSKGKTNFLVQSLCKRAVKSVSNNCYGQEWLC